MPEEPIVQEPLEPVEPEPEPIEPSPEPTEPARPSRFQERISELVARAKGAEDRARSAEERAIRAETLAQAHSQPEPPRFRTVAEVEDAYTKGELREPDRIRLLARLEGEHLNRQEQERQLLVRTADELDQYKSDVPDLMREGSQTRADVVRVYQEMAAQGFPQDIRTELWAVRQVIGPRDKTEQRRAIGDYTAHRSPRGPVPGSPTQPASPKSEKQGDRLWGLLNDEAKQFYSHMGYTETQVREDLEYADETVLRRAGRLK